MEVWKEREKVRLRLKNSYKKHLTKLRELFLSAKVEFTYENEFI